MIPMAKPELRILRLITWLPVGGIERRIGTILPLLHERGHHTEIVCLREYGALAERIMDKGIPVSLIPLKSRLHPAGIRALARFIKKGNFDIVHSHMYRSNVPGTIAAKVAGFKGVVLSQVHNMDTWETRRQRWMDRFLCRWRDGVIAVSERVKQDVIENLHLPLEKCYVLYNGIDIERYSNAEIPRGLREELGIRESDILVTMVARLVPQKNHHMVVEAAEDIVRREPRIKFMFVGDGKLREELEQQARERGIGQHVIFTGKRDDIPSLLEISDISILPSFKEGFSNAIIEAMASGLPVIASDVGGNPEAIEHDQCGYIIQPEDKEKFIAYTLRLAQDEDLRQRMSNNAAERAKKFSISEMVEHTENLYLKLLKSH